jgi:hypothetical protein
MAFNPSMLLSDLAEEPPERVKETCSSLNVVKL